MTWFEHPDSGQVFEAEGSWEKEARERGCKEVKPPKGAKSYARDEKPARAVKKEEAPEDDENPEAEKDDDKSADGGKKEKAEK